MHANHAAPMQLDTSAVAPGERVGFWADCIARLFQGLKSDVYGDSEFSGRTSTLKAGDVVLTHLEAGRHRVMRSSAIARATEMPYLKIVAPFVGCAGVVQNGRETWVTPGQWIVYDTTDSYAVANPEQVEHLIVMLPKQAFTERGLSAGALDALMARRLGGSGGVSRLALETMRSAYRELPSMPAGAARGVGDAITQLVHLSLLELAGNATAQTQREALRERIKQHVMQHLADPALSVDSIARAERQPAPALQRLHRRAGRGCRPHPVAPPRRLPARFRQCRLRSALDHRDRARLGLLQHGPLQPRLSRPARRDAERLPARGAGQRKRLNRPTGPALSASAPTPAPAPA